MWYLIALLLYLTQVLGSRRVLLVDTLDEELIVINDYEFVNDELVLPPVSSWQSHESHAEATSDPFAEGAGHKYG